MCIMFWKKIIGIEIIQREQVQILITCEEKNIYPGISRNKLKS